MLIPETVVLVLLPALSVAVPVADWAAPAALRVIGLVQLAIPERTSEQRKIGRASCRERRVAVGGWRALQENEGRGSLRVARGMGVAGQLKCTVTSLLFLPAEVGVRVRTVTGVQACVLPIFPETVVLVLLPALSVAVPVADWAAPAALRVIGLVQLAIPERTSEQR